MDLLDKSIVLELMSNCRISSQELADKYDSTRSVVRKRINRLYEIGVIKRFSLWYDLEMIDGSFIFGHIKLTDTAEKETVHTLLESNPQIHAVIPMVNGDVVIHAMVIGIDGLSSLGKSVRSIDGVGEAELHLLQGERRKRDPLKNIHFRVLAALFENSRISGSEIARRTGLSSRRVRRIMSEIIVHGGVIFGIERNPALGSGITFYLKIFWIDGKVVYVDLIKEIEGVFPEHTWESYVSASEPILFTRFMVEHIKDVESITRVVSELEGVRSVKTLVFYPARLSSIVSREHLREDIIEAGYSIESS